jgi:opacity protein-like surface antigen
MRMSIQLLSSLALGLALSFPMAVQAQMGNWYLKADAGGNITPSTDLKEFFGEPLAPGSEVEFDPGVRFGVGAGYHVTPWFATEVETGIFANEIKSVTDATRLDAVFSNVPLLGNLRFQCPRWERFQPYFGGGAGVSFPVIDADRIEIGGTSMHGSESDAVFAYQAFGGLRFKLNDQMGLSLEYRYFHADGAEWSDEFEEIGSDRLRFGATETHSISIVFDFRF